MSANIKVQVNENTQGYQLPHLPVDVKDIHILLTRYYNCHIFLFEKDRYLQKINIDFRGLRNKEAVYSFRIAGGTFVCVGLQ